MRLITNTKPPFLSDIIFGDSEKINEMKVAVAYCENYKLFEQCKKKNIKLDYFGRLDTSINLNLETLKIFSKEDNISIQIIGGSRFHPKVIWCIGHGSYIGSANLTKSAWEDNIECGLWLTQKELEDNDLIKSLNNFFDFIQKEAKSLTNISDQDISELERNKSQLENQIRNEFSKKNSTIIKESFGIFKGCSTLNNANNKLQERKEAVRVQSDHGTYREDKGWNDLNEMRCLLIWKKVKKGGFSNKSKLCKEMSYIEDVNLTYGSIGMKVSNYESLDPDGKPALRGCSKNTIRIYEEYKDFSVLELEKIIEKRAYQKHKNISVSSSEKNRLFFENLRKELKKRKEMEDLEPGKPTGKDRNGINISLKSRGYRGYITIFRPESDEPYLDVRYTWRNQHREKEREMAKAEFKILKNKLSHLIERSNENLKAHNPDFPWGEDPRYAFRFGRKGWKTEQEDKHWIIDRTVDLLKTLKNTNQK